MGGEMDSDSLLLNNAFTNMMNSGQYSQYLGVCQDSRPMRVRLNERLKRNEDEIVRLTAANDGIRALLADLDEHPVIERITDTVKRILG